MGKELESIGQVCSVGDLPEKLLEAEEAKVQVEGQLLERVSFSRFYKLYIGKACVR